MFPETNISTKVAFKELEIKKISPLKKEEFLRGSSKNTFSNWAKKKYPEIENIFSLLENLGVPRLTGTGSTIFLSYKTEKEALLLNLSLQNLLDNLLTNPHIHTQFYFDNIYK